MAVQVEETQQGNAVIVTVTGRLDGKDYDIFVPVVEALIQKRGKIRILLQMRDFHGWDGSALWEDIKFDWKHYSDIERIAMVGNSKWEQGMAIFCRPFTGAKIHYFPRRSVKRRSVGSPRPESQRTQSAREATQRIRATPQRGAEASAR